MKQTIRPRAITAVALLVGLPPAGLGCNEDVATELAQVAGNCLGEVVTVVATGYLQDALDLDDANGENDAGDGENRPMHDHEH